MQDLDSSNVHRNLDAKIKIGGLEALDLLLVLIISAMMGIFFDSGTTGFVFTFVIPLILLGFLYALKRNKPEGYLKDLIRYYLSPGFFSASAPVKNEIYLFSRIKKEMQNEG